MSEEVITDWVWSMFEPGSRVRWTTPTFVRRGTVTFVKGRSMRVHFDGFEKPTAIPDARQYFVDWMNGRDDYQLCAIMGKAQPLQGIVIDGLSELGQAVMEGDIDVATAANILGTDPKNVRRKLRAGTLPGRMMSGHWVMTADEIRKHAR